MSSDMDTSVLYEIRVNATVAVADLDALTRAAVTKAMTARYETDEDRDEAIVEIEDDPSAAIIELMHFDDMIPGVYLVTSGTVVGPAGDPNPSPTD